MGRARTKMMKLHEAKRHYLQSTQGITDIELAAILCVHRSLAYDYRKELGCVAVSPGRYTLLPTQEDIELAFTVLQRAQRSLAERLPGESFTMHN